MAHTIYNVHRRPGLIRLKPPSPIAPRPLVSNTHAAIMSEEEATPTATATEETEPKKEEEEVEAKEEEEEKVKEEESTATFEPVVRWALLG